MGAPNPSSKSNLPDGMTSLAKPPQHWDGAAMGHLQQQLGPNDSNDKCERWDLSQLLLRAPTATPGCAPSRGCCRHLPLCRALSITSQHRIPGHREWDGYRLLLFRREWSNGIWNKEGLLGCSTTQRGTPDRFCWGIPHYIHT